MAGASEEKRIGDYLVGKHELGRGTYGKVYLGTHVRTGKHVAAKKFTWEKQYLTEEAEREACLLMRIPDHENLVQLLDYIKIDTEKGGKAYVQFWMIVEYCPLGHLQEFAEKKRLSVCEKVNLATQCAHAVYHLHSQVPSVIHRDLKPKNILVVGSKKRPVVKLADLGESKLIEKINNETQLMSSVRGTSDFMAPEMFSASPSYNKSADVFSLGVTFLSVLDADSGVKVPKVGRECLGRYLQSQTEGFRYDITKPGDSAEVLQVKGVLSAMLEKDPASRLQIQQVLEHLEYLFITLRASQLQIPNERTYSLPSNWLNMSEDEDYCSVQLQTSSAEYTNVQQLFVSSLGHTRRIISIDRIQNKFLYQQYSARKALLKSRNPKGHSNEQKLWHGTSVDTWPKINTQGFNRSFCGKNATLYGDGVYFAIDASFSARGYAPSDAKFHKRMYLASVLTGMVTQGQSGMKAPPIRTGDILYDSVTDHSSNPGMFVIFLDASAYPEYLITFT